MQYKFEDVKMIDKRWRTRNSELNNTHNTYKYRDCISIPTLQIEVTAFLTFILLTI
jgi:hypothetical protein